MSENIEILKARYLLILRLIAIAFLSSTGFFLVFILMMKVSSEVFPFVPADFDGQRFTGFFPLTGVAFIIAGMLLQRETRKRAMTRFSAPSGVEIRLQRFLFSTTISYLLFQIAIIPGIAWFVVSDSIGWLTVFCALAVFFYIRDFPSKGLLDGIADERTADTK